MGEHSPVVAVDPQQQVEGVVSIDEEKNLIYYMGTSEGNWLERHLFCAPLDGSAAPRQITSEPGMHQVRISADPCMSYVRIRWPRAVAYFTA